MSNSSKKTGADIIRAGLAKSRKISPDAVNDAMLRGFFGMHAMPQRHGLAGRQDGDATTREGAEALLGFDLEKYAEEFDRDGKLSPESYRELQAKGFGRAIVDTFVDGLSVTTGEAGSEAATVPQEGNGTKSVTGGVEVPLPGQVQPAPVANPATVGSARPRVLTGEAPFHVPTAPRPPLRTDGAIYEATPEGGHARPKTVTVELPMRGEVVKAPASREGHSSDTPRIVDTNTPIPNKG